MVKMGARNEMASAKTNRNCSRKSGLPRQASRFCAAVAVLSTTLALLVSDAGAVPHPAGQRPTQQQFPLQLQLQRPLAAAEVIAVPVLGVPTVDSRQGRTLQLPQQPQQVTGRSLLTTSATNGRPPTYASYHGGGDIAAYRNYNARPAQQRDYNGGGGGGGGRHHGGGYPRHSHRHFHRHIGGGGFSGAGGLVADGGGRGQRGAGDGLAGFTSIGLADYGFGRENDGDDGVQHFDFPDVNLGGGGGDGDGGGALLADDPSLFREDGAGGQRGKKNGEDDVEYGDPDDVTLGDIGDGEGDDVDDEIGPIFPGQSQNAGGGGGGGGNNNYHNNNNYYRGRGLQQSGTLAAPPSGVRAKKSVPHDADGVYDADTDGGHNNNEGDGDDGDDALEDAGIELDDVNHSLSENEILDVVTLFNERRHAHVDGEADAPSAELIAEPPPREFGGAASPQLASRVLPVVAVSRSGLAAHEGVSDSVPVGAQISGQPPSATLTVPRAPTPVAATVHQ